MQIIQNRRHFLAGAAAAGAAGLLGTTTRAQAEAPPEDDQRPLAAFANVSDCQAAMYVSEELLRAEGFTDVQLRDIGHGPGLRGLDSNGETGFRLELPAGTYPLDRQRRADHGTGWHACRLPRTDRERQHPEHYGPQG